MTKITPFLADIGRAPFFKSFNQTVFAICCNEFKRNPENAILM